MSTKLSVIEAIVRGIAVDQLEEGVPPAFSESDLVSAINTVKGDFFGVRPEAFVTTEVSVQPPSDLSSTRYALLFTDEQTTVKLHGLIQSLADIKLATGKISITFRTSEAGSLFYFGDHADQYCACTVDGTGITVQINDTVNAVSVSSTLDGSFADDRYHVLEVSADGSEVTLTCEGETQSDAYTGWFLPSVGAGYLGYSNVGNVPDYLEGSISGFELKTIDDLDLHILDFENSVDEAFIIETSNGDDAEVFGPSVSWLSDDELAINQWALQQFCYGVAAFLLRQRSKDAHYRKAADSLHKLYAGG